MKFINHEEERIVVGANGNEYQYHLKDHLGNVRLTFTTKPTIDSITATFESANQLIEAQKFKNYPSGAQINNVATNARSGTSIQHLRKHRAILQVSQLLY